MITRIVSIFMFILGSSLFIERGLSQPPLDVGINIQEVKPANSRLVDRHCIGSLNLESHKNVQVFQVGEGVDTINNGKKHAISHPGLYIKNTSNLPVLIYFKSGISSDVKKDSKFDVVMPNSNKILDCFSGKDEKFTTVTKNEVASLRRNNPGMPYVDFTNSSGSMTFQYLLPIDIGSEEHEGKYKWEKITRPNTPYTSYEVSRRCWVGQSHSLETDGGAYLMPTAPSFNTVEVHDSISQTRRCGNFSTREVPSVRPGNVKLIKTTVPTDVKKEGINYQDLLKKYPGFAYRLDNDMYEMVSVSFQLTEGNGYDYEYPSGYKHISSADVVSTIPVISYIKHIIAQMKITDNLVEDDNGKLNIMMRNLNVNSYD